MLLANGLDCCRNQDSSFLVGNLKISARFLNRVAEAIRSFPILLLLQICLLSHKASWNFRPCESVARISEYFSSSTRRAITWNSKQQSVSQSVSSCTTSTSSSQRVHGRTSFKIDSTHSLITEFVSECPFSRAEHDSTPHSWPSKLST